MKMSSRSRSLVLLLTLALTSVGIEIAKADSYTWSLISNSYLPSANGALAIAMSSDGSKIIVGRDSDGVYLSSNSGSTFTKVSTSTIPNGSYYVSISDDGSKMLAASNATSTPNFYYSTDSGATWTSKTAAGTTPTVQRTCMSGNGTRWFILTNRGAYSTTDNGATWSYLIGIVSPAFSSCAMSDDGTKIFLLQFGTSLRYSSDSGATWTSNSLTSYPSANTVVSSADGSVIGITERDTKKFHISTNYGVTFTQKYVAASGSSIMDAAISSDGSRIALAVSGGRIAVSIDGGNNWSQETTSPSASWNAIGMNSSGSKIVASPLSSGATYQGLIPTPATLSLQSISPNSLPLIYRTNYTLSVLSNTAGKVTFYANGKKISKCSQVPTVSLVASCLYAPSVHGVITLTASVVPSDTSFLSATSRILQTSANVRSTKR